MISCKTILLLAQADCQLQFGSQALGTRGHLSKRGKATACRHPEVLLTQIMPCPQGDRGGWPARGGGRRSRTFTVHQESPDCLLVFTYARRARDVMSLAQRGGRLLLLPYPLLNVRRQ